MNRVKFFGVILVGMSLALFPAVSSHADDAARKQVLVDGVDYAVKLLESKGKAAFDDLKAYRFDKGRGYVYVVNMGAVMLFHPISPELLNKDCTVTRDTTGKFFGAEMKAKAEKSGKGWTSYIWPNPANGNKPEPRCAYYETANMGGTKVIVCAADFGISAAGCD